jgi:transposase
VAIERKRLGLDLLVDVRRLDRELGALKARITDAVDASGTSLLEVYGVGPIVAALILGHVGDPARFATPERFASYNATAPIEASSRPKLRHRLNPRGNRLAARRPKTSNCRWCQFPRGHLRRVPDFRRY